MLQQGVDAERLVGPQRFEGKGIGGKDVKATGYVTVRCRQPVPLLIGALPLFGTVGARAQETPSAGLQHNAARIPSSLIEGIARPGAVACPGRPGLVADTFVEGASQAQQPFTLAGFDGRDLRQLALQHPVSRRGRRQHVSAFAARLDERFSLFRFGVLPSLGQLLIALDDAASIIDVVSTGRRTDLRQLVEQTGSMDSTQIDKLRPQRRFVEVEHLGPSGHAPADDGYGVLIG